MVLGFEIEHITVLYSIIFSAALLPQIIMNYLNKSAKGVSRSMVFLAVASNNLYMIYAFFMGLPLLDKVSLPFRLLMLMIVMLQGFYSETDTDVRNQIMTSYVLWFVFVFSLFGLGHFYPYRVGNFAGWFCMGIRFVYQIPQVMKNYQRKSVAGLSFAYLSLNGLGSSLELVAAMLLGMPTQSWLGAIRGLVMYGIFCGQFVLYKGWKS